MLKRIKSLFLESYSNDDLRRLLTFRLLNMLLCIISLFMTVVNIATGETVLAYITGIYSALCLLNFFALRKQYLIIEILFYIETTAMLTAFIIMGEPDGFGILWTLLIPACTLSIFGKKEGTIFSCALFLIIIFFFWIPFGQSLLQYNYSKTYMLRFPIVYLCIYLISIYIEYIRFRTFGRLAELEQRNRWLYRHDALTGTYSRHAFYEEIDRVFINVEGNEVATIMLDIDDFKKLNDKYGHNAGDKILCELADIIRNNTCDCSLSCRWGGEEFLIVMKCGHNPVHIAEKIRMDVEDKEVLLDNGEIAKFTVSIGISFGDSTQRDKLHEYINEADKAMYESKEKGKNRVTISKKKNK